MTEGSVMNPEILTPLLRERIELTDGWRFHKGDPEVTVGLGYGELKPALLAAVKGPGRVAGAEPGIGQDVAFTQPDYDDSDWRHLNLPHDWGIEGPFVQEYPGESGKLGWWGIGWYRKRFTLPASDAGRRVCLDIDGAMSYATIWINGQFVGGWPYGYSSYQVDLSPYVKPGEENVVAIRLENPEESSRWYAGGGLYRKVWLSKTDPVHVGHWGTFVTTEIRETDAVVRAQTTVTNDSDASAKAEVVIAVLDAKQELVAQADPVLATLDPGGEVTVTPELRLNEPRRWSLEDTYRYTLVTEVRRDGHPVDRTTTPFGVRQTEWDADRGFLLNGKLTKLNGVCMHHDLGALGAAVNVRALERQVLLLKSMGCNAIRTAHNPPTPELLDLCDAMGMLVMDETFDTWTLPKKPNGYATLYADWSELDFRAMIRRDRNHPSVILWSIGNEVREQGHPELHHVAHRLNEIVHEEDPSRLSTTGSNHLIGAYNGFQDAVDVFGFNYKWWEYPKFHATHPSQPIVGAETSSTVSSRGEYVFPVVDDKSQGKFGFHVSAYDLYAPAWAVPPDLEFRGLDQAPYVAGEFVWTGFDYLGEPTPFGDDDTILLNFQTEAERAKAAEELSALGKVRVPSRSSYFGIFDLAGFPKDRFYLYQARWLPEHRMAHILPHWTWPERVGKVTPVHVYTSGDEGELFLNGRSLGRQRRGPYEYRLRWDDVVYEAGELRVVTYKNGERWAEAVQRTAGPARCLRLLPDRKIVADDGQDLCYVTAQVVDAQGALAPRANDLIHFSVEGPGDLIATDNGDPTDHTVFATAQRHAFNGLAVAIVRTRKGEKGTITVRATAEGHQAAAAKFFAE